MQNTCFLFRDRASICQVNQQHQAQWERKREKNNHQNGAIPCYYPQPFVKQTNKQTQNNKDISAVSVFLYKLTQKRKMELDSSVSDWVTGLVAIRNH